MDDDYKEEPPERDESAAVLETAMDDDYEEEPPWKKWGRHIAQGILCVLIIAVSASNMPLIAVGMFFFCLIVLATLSVKKNLRIWEVLFWIALFFLVGPQIAIICFAVMTLVCLSQKASRKKIRDPLEWSKWSSAHEITELFIDFLERMGTLFIEIIDFLRTKPIHVLMIVAGLVILGVYWKSLPDYPKVYPTVLEKYHTDSFLPITVDGKHGYRNLAGKIVIAPVYDEVDTKTPFPTSKRQVRVKANGKYGYINSKGEAIIPLRFDAAEYFDYYGMARVRIGNKWGWIGQNGKEITPLRFDEAGEFPERQQLSHWEWLYRLLNIHPATFDHHALAKVMVDGKWGYIDMRGKEIIPLRYDEIYDDKKRHVTGDSVLALVRERNRWFWIDFDGKEITPSYLANIQVKDLQAKQLGNKWGYVWNINRLNGQVTNSAIVVAPRFDAAHDFPNSIDRAKVMLGGKWGYIDSAGKEVIPLQFEAAEAFEKTSALAKVRRGGKWGWIDMLGKMVISPHFDAIDDFDANGLARVRQGKKWGYVDTKGQEIIAPHFDEAGFSDTTNGQEKVALNGKWGLIDLQGQEILPLRFDEILNGHHVTDGILALVREGTKWHWLDAKGEEIIPAYVNHANFRNLKPLRLTLSHTAEKYGYADKGGALVIAPYFDDAWAFAENGLAPVRFADGKWGWIDARGKTMIPARFDAIANFNAHGLAKVGIGSHCDRDTEENTGQTGILGDCQWGWIDAWGKEIIPVRFVSAGEFDDRRLAVLRYDEEWGMVNTQGEEIVPVRFTELHTGETVGEDIAALVREDDTWTWFDLDGKTLIPDYVVVPAKPSIPFPKRKSGDFSPLSIPDKL
jgi:hypothetical protein